MAQLFRRILSPIDFDENSIIALDLACKIAAQHDATLYLTHVVPFPIAPPAPGSLRFPSSGTGSKSEARAARTRARIPSTVRYEIVSRMGLPVDVIIRLEEELAGDLVVMATHGRSRSSASHLFLGSVAERVVRRSRCPVIVVPPP
jgi:nucleotide-binding universal stress UspA family protein